jgi:MFS family permease
MRKQAFLFCLLTGIFWFSLYIYVPVVSNFAVSLGANLFFVGLISGIYGLTQMLLRIPVGMASDRLGRRAPFIAGGVIFAALAGAPVLLIHSASSLLLCRALGGVAAAGWVPFTVYFSSFFPPEEGPKAMGIINASNNVGELAAMILCGAISGVVGRPALFAISTAAGVCALALCFTVREQRPARTSPVTLREFARVPFRGGLMLISVLGLLSQYIVFATAFGFTPVVAQKLGAADSQVSLMLTLFMFPAVITSALSGRIDAKFGSGRVACADFLLFAAACAAIPFARSLAALYILSALCGMAQGSVFPVLMGLVVKRADEKSRGAAMGFFQAVYGLGMFLGPVIVGAFGKLSGGLTRGFLATAAVGAAAAILSLRLGRPSPRRA